MLPAISDSKEWRSKEWPRTSPPVLLAVARAPALEAQCEVDPAGPSPVLPAALASELWEEARSAKPSQDRLPHFQHSLMFVP
jgi:hypothetical protein